MVGFLVLYALFVGVIYGRQRRWWGVGGWILLVAGVAALSAGLGDDFAWGGLVFIGVSAVGVLCIALDIVGRRQERPARRE